MAHAAFIQEIKYLSDEIRFLIWDGAPVHTEKIDMLLKRYNGKMRIIAAKQPGFSLKASKTIQEELISVAEKAVNDIMLIME